MKFWKSQDEALSKLLEPGYVEPHAESFENDDPLAYESADFLASIAISLRRIADALHTPAPAEPDYIDRAASRAAPLEDINQERQWRITMDAMGMSADEIEEMLERSRARVVRTDPPHTLGETGMKMKVRVPAGQDGPSRDQIIEAVKATLKEKGLDFVTDAEVVEHLEATGQIEGAAPQFTKPLAEGVTIGTGIFVVDKPGIYEQRNGVRQVIASVGPPEMADHPVRNRRREGWTRLGEWRKGKVMDEDLVKYVGPIP